MTFCFHVALPEGTIYNGTISFALSADLLPFFPTSFESWCELPFPFSHLHAVFGGVPTTERNQSSFCGKLQFCKVQIQRLVAFACSELQAHWIFNQPLEVPNPNSS